LIAHGKVAYERHANCLVLIAVVSVHRSLNHAAQHDATGKEDVDDVEEEIMMIQTERADAVAS
jgi:hypothetical protein